ncbi:MAG: ATP-binding protein [Chloroflexi bacterium]|nr:ATP-binding protein [Chloroflexota bacterium]
MPRLGGEADKFGNRYESLWAVDAVLDLVDDEQYVEITFEAIGDEAAGVEFFRTTRSGAREYHSIKRQQPDGNWTISRLAQEISPGGRSILRDLTRKIETGAEGVFSSGTSATELEELTERARASDSIQEFRQRISGSGQLSGRFYGPIVDICGDDTAAYVALRRLRVRTKNEPELTKDVERRVRAMFRMSNGDPTDPTAVRLLVADFVTQKLGAQLTVDSFLSHLRGHGVLPLRLAGNGPVGQLIERLNRLYLNEVDRLLINQARIDRLESTAACTVLLDKGKSVMLEGPAGDGKTCVMAQVIDQLTEQGVPCLVLRLDRLNEYDHSAQMVGTRRGLPESPAITLGEFAGDRPSVLCIDQLDALSIVSARQQSAWDAFNELLDEVESYPNMRILFACRSFDLEQDAQLRALASDASRIERMPIGLLDEDTIQAAIAASGIEAALLSGAQLRILSIPLHLYLYLETSNSGKVDFASKGDLFDAFWNYKESRVESLAGQSSVWPRAVDVLCDAMSQRETLVAPLYVMDEYREARTAMASEAVIYAQDDYIRFFHEAFFDYAFARGFLRANSDLVGWLVSDKQHLFRRSQVRQVLAFLRGREQDRARYLQTLKDLLAHEGIRFHIKKLVLDWLHSLPDPTQDEWLVVEALEEQLGGHRWSVVHNSVAWFDVLHEMNRWESWLLADADQIDRAIRLMGAPDVFSARSAVVSGLIAPFRGHSDEWRGRLLWLVQVGYGYTSPEMEDLALALIADGTLD